MSIDERSQIEPAHSSGWTIGPTRSSRRFPGIFPSFLRDVSVAGKSFATTLPRRVRMTGSPVSANCEITERHLTLNSETGICFMDQLYQFDRRNPAAKTFVRLAVYD